MPVTRIRQDKIWSLGSGIDDTKTPTDHDTNAVDLQDTIDHLASQIADITGESTWEAAPDDTISSMAAKTWLEDKTAMRRILHHSSQTPVDITVANGENWVPLVVASNHTPSVVISLNTSTEGAVCAQLGAAEYDSHQLTEVAGKNALNPKNLCLVWDGDTGDPIQSSSRQVYALLQVEDTAANNTAFDDSTNQGQLSFVRANATYSDLEACPVADIEDKKINYAYPDRKVMANWDEQDWMADTVLVDMAAAGVSNSLDIAYNGGSVVTVDTTDVDWQLTDAEHFYVSDSTGSARILDVHAEAAGDELEINAPGGITINGGDIAAASNKATFTGVEIGGATGQVASTGANDLVLVGQDDITFTTTRQAALPLDDATAGSISALAGGPHASISAAIKYAIESGATFTLGVTVLGSNYAQDVNVPGGAGGLDISSPHSIDMNTPSGVDTFLFLNGVLQYGGNVTTQNSVYDGTTPASGDIKFDYPRGVKSGDVITALRLG